MLKIGLTGGIGSGKSTVGDHFLKLGVPVIDADQIAHQLVEPGQPALAKIILHFGKDIVDADGRLDRARLRQLVFSDAGQRKVLEAILHPLVGEEMQRRASTLHDPYCVLSIPLLLENGLDKEVDRVLVVDTTPQLQLARAAQRDAASRENIQAIIASQIDRQSRLEAADDIIHNDGDIPSLLAQVNELHAKYLLMAKTCSKT